MAALVTGGAGRTAILANTWQFWILVMAWPILGERIRGAQWLSVALGLGGLVLIIEPWSLEGIVSSILALAGAVCFAASSIVAKVLRQRHHPDLLTMTGWQTLIGSIPLVLIAIFAGGGRPEWSQEFIWSLAYTSSSAPAEARSSGCSCSRSCPPASPVWGPWGLPSWAFWLRGRYWESSRRPPRSRAWSPSWPGWVSCSRCRRGVTHRRTLSGCSSKVVLSPDLSAPTERAAEGGRTMSDAGEWPVLAIVPAHNEAGRVGEVVRALRAQGLPVLVVDDGSSDGSGAEAEAAGARVLRQEPNQGKGAALKAGFREALGAGGPGTAGPAFLTLDADGQHDPAKVPEFLRRWEEGGADLVIGARDYAAMPRIRWFTNSVSRLLFSWAMGEHIPDNQSGYRLHSRRLAEIALASEEQGFAFEVEEIALCLGRGYGLAWVPIPTIYGTEKSDIKPWTHLSSFVRVTRRARRLMREERRAGRGGVGRRDAAGRCLVAAPPRPRPSYTRAGLLSSPAGARAHTAAYRLDPSPQAVAALFGGLVDAGLARVDFVEGPVAQRRQVGHDDVGSAGQTQFAAGIGIDRGQGRGAGNVGLGADQPRKGDGLVGHQSQYLLVRRYRGVPRPEPSGVWGWGINGPMPIMSRSSRRNRSISSQRADVWPGMPTITPLPTS